CDFVRDFAEVVRTEIFCSITSCETVLNGVAACRRELVSPYREAVFHLGVVRLLNETGQLSQVKRIGAVSGGSILAAHLVLHWKQYAGSNEDFDKAAQEIIQFFQEGIGGRGVRRGIFDLRFLTSR